MAGPAGGVEAKGGRDSVSQVPQVPLSTVASQIQFPFCIFYPLTDLQRFKYNRKLQTSSKEVRAGEACPFSLGL